VATTYVAPILQASSLNPTLVISNSGSPPVFCVCGTPIGPPGNPCSGAVVQCDGAGTGATPSICVQQNVDLGISNYTPQSCGTAVSFQYPFSLPLPFTPPSIQTIKISTTVRMRFEQ
jgi:hypothetical protein